MKEASFDPMLVAFDTLNLYYLPQYFPVFRELGKRGHRTRFVCYVNKNKAELFERAFEGLGIDCSWVHDQKEAAGLYAEIKPDWIFFGNSFDYLGELHPDSRTAQTGHGIGPKPSYYHKSSTPMTVRFMEGRLRLEKIRELYPEDNFVQTGFSKLDPLFNGEEPGLDFSGLGLDPGRPTILYAPTFNPSSIERFPDDWPADFDRYNILVKPHTFTWSRERYAKQREKLKKWAEFSNVYVAGEDEFSLLPFMKGADILLSEASSTLFEFAALGRPVIVCNFFKLKWLYRGLFHYRFERRFGRDNILYKDIGLHVGHYKELPAAVAAQLSAVGEYEENRLRYTRDHVGATDGRASARIVDYLENPAG